MKRFLFLSLLVSELLRKYDARVPVVHLKDYSLDGETGVEQDEPTAQAADRFEGLMSARRVLPAMRAVFAAIRSSEQGRYVEIA